MGRWIARHAHALCASVHWLREGGAGALCTMLVFAVSLALPLGLAVLLLTLRAAGPTLAPPQKISLYLKPGISEQQAQQLAGQVRARPGVASVTMISASQALQDLRTQALFGAALDALPANPLPNVLEIVPTPAGSSAAALEALRLALSAFPETDAVQFDRAAALRLDALTVAFTQLLRVTAALLGLGLLAVVGNTIRLEIGTRRAEIELARLLGGSNAFIRRPFLYLGALYGFCAALLASGLVALASRALTGPIAELGAAYGRQFALQQPRPREIGALFVLAVVLGWLGAAIAAAQQLSRLRLPRA